MLKSTHVLLKYSQILLIIAVIIGLNPQVILAANLNVPPNFKFLSDLKYGDSRDPDVIYLQTVLNSKDETRVAESGPGSMSGLTTYFGTLTKIAVSKFQELYKSEVLAPAGLSSPTGVVGFFTRKKLNELLTQSPVTTIQPYIAPTPMVTTSLASTSTNNGGINVFPYNTQVPNLNSNGVIISGLSTYKTKPGLVMSIFGLNFRQSNTVYLGSVKVGTYGTNQSGTQITFKIPDIQNGKYQIGVVNEFGTTTLQTSLPLTIEGSATSSATSTQPVIKKISPTSSSYVNDLILISGENFTLNNTVSTNLGDLKNIPSLDGQRITFLAGSLPYYFKAKKEYKGSAVNLVIKINNENGTSTNSATHVINFPTGGSSINQSPQQTSIESINDSIANDTSQDTTSQSTQNTNSNLGASATTLVAGAAVGSIAASTIQGPKVQDYFGGTIVSSIVCTCSGGTTFLVVDDYASNTAIPMIFDPKLSKLNMNFNIWSIGAYVIGGLMPVGGVCMVYAGTSCTVAGAAPVTIDMIRGVGTSPY